MTLLLTVGGTPLEAMHKYAPMCNRFTRGIVKVGPSIERTKMKLNLNVIIMLKEIIAEPIT